VFLPVLFRLHIPNSKKKPNPDATVSKTEAARALLNLLSRAFPERRVHLVADALYREPAWRDLPTNTTFTTSTSATAIAPRPQPARAEPTSFTADQLPQCYMLVDFDICPPRGVRLDRRCSFPQFQDRVRNVYVIFRLQA
jgi:hypothetical protein